MQKRGNGVIDARGLSASEIQGTVSRNIGQSDILIGVPGCNNALTIGGVIQTACAGLAKYFPAATAVFVYSDAGSQDGAPEVVGELDIKSPKILLAHRVNPMDKFNTPYYGIPGRTSAFRLIFEVAKALGVKACLLLDPALRSITPEWMELLLKPILYEGYEYVSPCYRRHKYDATITNHIVYPLSRALYGKRIRQPIGGEFCVTGELAGHYLTKNIEEADSARHGIDLWMATTAIANGRKICQTCLGPRLRDSKSASADLSVVVVQVVGSVLSLMEEYEYLWKEVNVTEPVPIFRVENEMDMEPLHINMERMIKAFQLGLGEFFPLWQEIFPPQSLETLSALQGFSVKGFHLSDALWVRLVYDMALAAHRRIMTREHLLKSFIPLYLGRVASFILETEKSSPQDVEEKIENLCLVFEQEKSYLVKRWDQPIPTREGGKP